MEALADRLARAIREGGAMPLQDFMAAALGEYYGSRDPLGAGGDFITAPEISQMFGELIGLWCAILWQAMGSPEKVILAELGPGRGTLMADLLRAAGMVPGFRPALEVWLVETSAALRECQRRTLAHVPVHWAERAEDLPDGPLLLVANEFFDALPIAQYERRGGAWAERRVGLDRDGRFTFVSGPPAALVEDAPDGSIAEICPEGRRIARALGDRLARRGGAALIIDYGHGRSGLGDTLQAVRGHRFHPVLDEPGTADLTAHVDFEALAAAAIPARAHGPVTQGEFLTGLGITTRAAKLAEGKSPAMAEDILGRMRRLISDDEMGTLFKVMALAHPALPVLPGF